MGGKARRIRLGPGFLVTAAFIGPGTVTTCTLAGARFGTTLLFTLVFATITTIVLQEMTGRLSLGSGRDLAAALREFPQSRVTRAVFLILTLSAVTLGCAAYEAGNIIGGSMGLEMVTGFPRPVWVLATSALAGILLSRGRHVMIERSLIALVCLMSAAFLATLIIVRPDPSILLRGLIPRFPSGSTILALALVGTTVVPYNLFLHSASVLQRWRDRAHLRDVRLDLILSVGLGGVVSASVLIASAQAFFDSGTPVANGAQMARQLEPLFGPLAGTLFGIGFFAAGLSSAITAPYAAAFASCGILGWKGGTESPRFRAVWAGVILVGLVISLSGFTPLSVIVFAQVANGLILPLASVFLLAILNSRRLMGDLINSGKQNLIGGLVILAVSLLGIWHIIRLFL